MGLYVPLLNTDTEKVFVASRESRLADPMVCYDISCNPGCIAAQIMATTRQYFGHNSPLLISNGELFYCPTGSLDITYRLMSSLCSVDMSDFLLKSFKKLRTAKNVLLDGIWLLI